MHATAGALSRWLIMFATLFATFAATASVRAQDGRQIPAPFADLTQVADDTYVWRYRDYVTLFIVTDEGVIAADPIGLTNPREPELYKEVIRSVTDQPVRYLILSHGAEDHAAGADVFADTATIIGTQLTADKLIALNSPRHLPPTVIVNDYMRLELGGKVVDLYWAGPHTGGDYLFLHYPAGRVLFAVDWVAHRRLPFRDLEGTTSLEALTTSMEWIETSFDYDVFVPGHGALGTRDSIREQREYFTDIAAAIRAAQAEGLPDNSDAMVAAVRASLAPRYGTWSRFNEYLAENIRGVTRIWSEQ